MSKTALIVGAVGGVFIGEFVNSKFGAHVAKVPQGPRLVTAGGVLAGLFAAKKFLG